MWQARVTFSKVPRGVGDRRMFGSTVRVPGACSPEWCICPSQEQGWTGVTPRSAIAQAFFASRSVILVQVYGIVLVFSSFSECCVCARMAARVLMVRNSAGARVLIPAELRVHLSSGGQMFCLAASFVVSHERARLAPLPFMLVTHSLRLGHAKRTYLLVA